MTRRMFWRTGIVISVLALAASAGLLIADARGWEFSANIESAISAAPLLLVGVSFLLVQPVIRPRLAELTKNLLLAATFLLWGAIQLMPQNELARRLGSVVVALYVVDLAWVVLTLGSANEKK